MIRKQLHPKDVPLSRWPSGWLVMQTANLLNEPQYIILHEHERKTRGWPDNDDARREFIGRGDKSP
jgi:hypothetical protein